MNTFISKQTKQHSTTPTKILRIFRAPSNAHVCVCVVREERGCWLMDIYKLKPTTHEYNTVFGRSAKELYTPHTLCCVVQTERA